ncbi:MAG: hypothetical protein ACRD5K_20265 [Candidatus Acidiferrales bacterium]
MRAVLERAFSSAVTQADKNAAKHLWDTLRATHSVYQSVIFDVLEMTTRQDRRGLAEMAFLTGMQAGYELGLECPPPPAKA